jgi:hypothetical protein
MKRGQLRIIGSDAYFLAINIDMLSSLQAIGGIPMPPTSNSMPALNHL